MNTTGIVEPAVVNEVKSTIIISDANQCSAAPALPTVPNSTTSVHNEIRFNGTEISKLTKRQLKKYKKCLKYQEAKKEKRAKERIKAKEKRKQAKLNNIDLGPSRKELKQARMELSACKIGVCIDLSFDDLMIDKVISYYVYNNY